MALKSENGLLRCPRCEADIYFGRCSSRECGWQAPWRLEQEARRKAKVKRGYGTPTKLAPKVGEFPKPKRVVKTESGKIIRQEYNCPICKGKGWLLNPCTSCELCFGKGIIGYMLLMQWWSVVKKDQES